MNKRRVRQGLPRGLPSFGEQAVEQYRKQIYPLEQMRKIRGYVAEIQKVLIAARKRYSNTKMVWQAAAFANSLRVPKEKFIELIREQGVDGAVQALQGIAKMERALQKPHQEIENAINQQGVVRVYQELMEEYEQKKQMGMVA